MKEQISIRNLELKKAFTSPVVYALLILFIGFNFFYLYTNSYFKSELAVLTETVDQLGYKIHGNMMSDFQTYYDSHIVEMNETVSEKTSKTYDSAASFFEDGSINREELFTEKEMESMIEVLVLENYYSNAQEIDEYYENIDVSAVAEQEIQKYGITGEAATTVRNQFAQLEDRFNQLILNGEHKTLFFHGKAHGMHSLLFKNIFRFIIFEAMILSVLITGFLTVYEFENKTHLTAYSAKRGRKLAKDKLWSSITASMMITTIILGLTLIGFFVTFNYAGLWNVPISSYFNIEYDFPYISWWKMSFGQYVIAAIVLVYICQLIFTLITFIISVWVKNSYVVFLAFGILLGLGVVIQGFVPTNSNLLFIAGMTPFNLILNPHLWFIGWSVFSFKYMELYTVLIWIVLSFILCLVSLKYFKKSTLS
ncbi:hypothetical protein ACLIBG_08085 [Virgibacillus sp. W0181]|uniref:hypothetical protein n=1 Tax=Virgibacillus sp. W0181 TaxID=3391581 RepID=UPI003F4606E4